MVIRALQLAIVLLFTGYCVLAWSAPSQASNGGLDVWAPNVQTWIVSVLTALGFPELARRVINWIKQVRALEERVDDLEKEVEDLKAVAFEHFNTR